MNSSEVPRLRLFISAYACSPYQGSELGVGWGFISRLAAWHDLDVVVEEEKFRDEIKMWISENPDHPAARIRFHFIRKRRNRTLRKIWPPSYYRNYRNWHIEARNLALELDVKRDFHILHQLTMVGFREPGYLWELEKPFVWGPVGGAGYLPWRFLLSLGWYGALYYSAYNIVNFLQLRFLRRPKAAAERAGSALIVATSENQSAARRFWNAPATVLTEVGLFGRSKKTPTARAPDEPLRIVWSGQHTPRKALNIALLALSQLPNEVYWEIHILGDGAVSRRWQRLAERLGIDDRCIFHGRVERDVALRIVGRSHVALITSLRDLTSSVTVEALELGVPVVAPAHCGFTDVITSECGILLPVRTPRETVNALSQAVLHLEANEKDRYQLANGALHRASCFDWSGKCDVLSEIYVRRLEDHE